MLRVIQNRSAASAKSYYAHSDYLSEGQELTGRWGGKAAQLLGLKGDVDKQSFDRLCDNLDPRSGERLTLRTKGDRTTGYDFNFHAPKGVTLAMMLGGDDRVLYVFRDSVDETMREIEQDASTRVRKHGVQGERTTGNLVWADYTHLTTRPIDGTPDGHLHAHCFVFNTTWDDTEHAWKAGQFRELKRDAPYYEAAFHSRLAMRMRELGYEIRRDGRDWDIANIDKSITSKFSRRTDQIEKLADELGIDDPNAKSELGAKSRAKKTKEHTMPELVELWKERLELHEVEQLNQLKSLQNESRSIEPDMTIEAEAMQYAKLHCFERNSVVPKRQLMAEALRHGLGNVSVDGIELQLNEQGVIYREMEGRVLATTPEVIAEEQSLLKTARAGRDSHSPLNPDWSIKQEWLNQDQQNAVRHVLQSTDSIMMIRGGAGTGKTTLMREAVSGIEAGGHRVFTFAPSAEASRGVLKAEGFDAATVAELLVNPDLQNQVAGQVIWIDEAGLLGTRTMKQVLDIASAGNSPVILSGDWKQHGSVERGAAMRLLEHQAGIQPAHVREILRQQGEYREAVALLSEGKTRDGMAALDKLGWVHEIEDRDERNKTIASEFAIYTEAGQTVLAVAPTHVEADQLTESIRSELRSRGIVDKTEQTFTQLKPLYLTEAEKTDLDRVMKGDVVVFQQNAKGVKKGERFETTGTLPINLTRSAKRFEVYRKQDVRFAKGDSLRITANGQTKDGKHRLNNGSVYHVRSFTDQGDIKLNNGWIVDRQFGFIAPGYVSTSHASQGKSVDRVLIAESSMSFPAAGREQFYVSVSRGRKQASIYTDDKLLLTDAVNKADRRMTGTELLDGDYTRDYARRDQAHQNHRQIEPQRERELEPLYERG